MRRDATLTKEPRSSFLSYEKDLEIILRKIFVESRPYDEFLKRLLVIHTKDCIDNTTSETYKKAVEEMSLSRLIEEGYVVISPRIEIDEHEEEKSYIVITMDDFVPNAENPQFRDCTIMIDVLCPTKHWDLGNYRIRPLKILGFIDAILNESKLTGIGTLNFMGCAELVVNPDLAGYTIMYRAIHGSDDRIESK